MVNKYPNLSVIEHHCLLNEFGFLDETLGRYELDGRTRYYDTRGHPSNDVLHLGPLGYERFMQNIRDCVINKRKRSDYNSKRIPHTRPDRSSSRGTTPRHRLPQARSQPPSQPDLCLQSVDPLAFPTLHPTRLGFSPFPSQPSALLPTPRSFSGDYLEAVVGRQNSVPPHRNAHDRQH